MVHKLRKTVNQFGTLLLTAIRRRMSQQYNIRWAFNAKQWTPKPEEILAGSSFIQPEEKERIEKFVYQDDAKSTLIGRLMLKKFVYLATKIPYQEIRLARDERGKPYLLNPTEKPIHFNVSHQGDYVVVAGNTEYKCGIDIMKIEPPANKNIQEFLRIMRRQIGPSEWTLINSFDNDLDKMSLFYRHWCLKESYGKNTGEGIPNKPGELDFRIKSVKLKIGQIVTDTVLYENMVQRKGLVFEETLLDERHSVAVCLTMNEADWKEVPYVFLDFESVVLDAEPLFETDPKFRDSFMCKGIKHF